MARGLSADVFEMIISEHELCTGEFVLSEFKRVLLTKFKASPKIVADFESYLQNFDIAPTPPNKSQIQVRDEDDRWVLQSALDAKAEILLTGDKDLLDMNNSVTEIDILNPRQFWEKLRS